MNNVLTPDAVWVKHAAESRFRGFTLTDLATGETIASATCVVVPVATGGVTVNATATVSGANVSTLISAGKAGEEYDVRFTIVTSSQPAIVKVLRVKVIA